MKTKVLVVAGPTASGKTGLGIALARRLDGEIVCADSIPVCPLPLRRLRQRSGRQRCTIWQRFCPRTRLLAWLSIANWQRRRWRILPPGVRCLFWLAAPGCLLTALLTTFSLPMCRRTRTCAGSCWQRTAQSCTVHCNRWILRLRQRYIRITKTGWCVPWSCTMPV